MQDLIDASTLVLTTFKQEFPPFDGIVDTPNPASLQALKNHITLNREEKYASLINLLFLNKEINTIKQQASTPCFLTNLNELLQLLETDEDPTQYDRIIERLKCLSANIQQNKVNFDNLDEQRNNFTHLNEHVDSLIETFEELKTLFDNIETQNKQVTTLNTEKERTRTPA